GHQVDVVLPRYRGIGGTQIDRVRAALGRQVVDADIYASAVEGGAVRYVFVDQPAYYDRDYLYGVGVRDYADNAERFAFLARAALESAGGQPFRYDVLYAHAWPARLVLVLMAPDYAYQPRLRGVTTVFTIHTHAYQATVAARWLL